jgi:hypothetical protein
MRRSCMVAGASAPGSTGPCMVFGATAGRELRTGLAQLSARAGLSPDRLVPGSYIQWEVAVAADTGVMS